MSTRSETIGKHLINSIDGIETSATNGLHSGADGARKVTRIGSRWAAKQETTAARQLRMLKRRLEKETAQLNKAAGKSVDWATSTARNATISGSRYIKKNPWPAVAITAAAGLLVGALLARRER
jgi:ElaB/YqjD/DUF883 family membrane-anchored ribosome-binding protein